jgi:hypothetical protein
MLHFRDGRAFEGRPMMRDGKPCIDVQGKCSRCGGEGRSNAWARTGYTCYQCGGDGRGKVSRVPLYAPEELEKLNAAKAKADATRAAKAAAKHAAAESKRLEAEAARAEALQANPLFVRAQGHAGRNEFIADVVAKWKSADISEKQEAALLNACARIEAQDASKAAANAAGWLGKVDDRVEIDGVVLFMKCVHYGEGSWDPNRYLVKIRNANGAVLSWFTSSGRYVEGDPMKGTAKIKKHDEYRGEKSTVIGNFRAVKGA